MILETVDSNCIIWNKLFGLIVKRVVKPSAIFIYLKLLWNGYDDLPHLRDCLVCLNPKLITWEFSNKNVCRIDFKLKHWQPLINKYLLLLFCVCYEVVILINNGNLKQIKEPRFWWVHKPCTLYIILSFFLTSLSHLKWELIPSFSNIPSLSIEITKHFSCIEKLAMRDLYLVLGL